MFAKIPPPANTEVQRFVVGEDAAPHSMSADEIAQELGDPFGQLLLLNGIFPATATQLLQGIDDGTVESDPLREQRSFLLGEESKLLPSDDLDSTNTGLRFLISRGGAGTAPELILSASHPEMGLVEVMGWDQKTGGFNYYRNILPSNGSWVFAGNSRHALSEPTRGRGPFETHTSGNFIMKELRFPWLHWHSFAANIFADVFPEADLRRTHPWFTQKQGAEVCEETVAKPSVRRWVNARFEGALATDGTFSDPKRVTEQILTSPTVNLITSTTESGSVNDRPVDLPQTFFVDSEALTEILGLASPLPFAVAPELYRASLVTFDFALKANGFVRPGDTHFAFVIPERAFEDNEVLRKAIEVGLITRRFAASLLMVDFPNPIFSPRRAKLLDQVPAAAVIAGGVSSFSEEMANNIVAAAQETAQDSPEREFAELWAAGDSWEETINARLNAYYSAVASQLTSQEGFDAYVRLAETRREQVRTQTPLAEFPLLFPTIPEAKISRIPRIMRSDGTVDEIGDA